MDCGGKAPLFLHAPLSTSALIPLDTLEPIHRAAKAGTCPRSPRMRCAVPWTAAARRRFSYTPRYQRALSYHSTPLNLSTAQPKRELVPAVQGCAALYHGLRRQGAAFPTRPAINERSHTTRHP